MVRLAQRDHCLTARRRLPAARQSLGCLAIHRSRQGLPPRTSPAHRTLPLHEAPSDPNGLHGLGVSLYFKLQSYESAVPRELLVSNRIVPAKRLLFATSKVSADKTKAVSVQNSVFSSVFL